MMRHEEFSKKLLTNPDVAREYKSLEAEFALLDEQLKARAKAGATKAEAHSDIKTAEPLLKAEELTAIFV